jgi:epoxide hydrolase-like predicted phosphatase
MIRAIIFDCFGVLTTDRWRSFTDSLPTDVAQQCRECNRAYDSGHITREEFLHSIHELTGKSTKEIDDLLWKNLVKNDALFDYIRELKGQEYKIGLLSNVSSNWIRDTFMTIEEQQLFDAMVFSYETGITKPNPRAFELAAKKLDVSPRACVMVDDIDHYCESAKDMGMQAIIYTGMAQFKGEMDALLADSKQ